MKGLELSERFYQQEVSKIIEDWCPVLKERYAAGLIGYGSDVLGHDDEISRDHEWGPRCILWLREADYNRYSAKIDKAFGEHLPPMFLNFPTRFKVDNKAGCLVPCSAQESGMHHITITTVRRYMRIQFGVGNMQPGILDWLSIPEQKLLEFTRGKVFFDPAGEITEARQRMLYFPDDIWRYKLAYAWESTYWNLDVIGLCYDRGDILSARLSLNKVIERLIRLVFMLNRKYCPGTLKWVSREFYDLPELATEVGKILEKCFVSSDIRSSVIELEDVIRELVKFQNSLSITEAAELSTPSWVVRGQVRTDLGDVVNKLRQSLPSELQELEIHGGCDQWVTNDDILLWSGQFQKFKHIYTMKAREHRKGVGDMMI